MGILHSVPKELFDVEVGNDSSSQRKVLLVFGYLRLHFECAIHVDIITHEMMRFASICCDEWDAFDARFNSGWSGEKENPFHVSVNNTLYTRNWSMRDGYEWNAFGRERVQKGQIKTWRLKVAHNPRFSYEADPDKDTTKLSSMIGVIEDSDSCKSSIYLSAGYGGGYWLSGEHGFNYGEDRVHASGQQKEVAMWQENDIVTVTLDMIGGIVRFSLNEKQLADCYRDIDVEKVYVLAVHLWFDEMVQICEM